MIGRSEITAIINTVYDAVNASKAGPISVTNEHGEMILQSLGYNTYLYAISKLIPAVIESKMEVSGDVTDDKGKVQTIEGNMRIGER